MNIAYIGHENEDGDSARNTHLLVVAADEPKPPRSLSAPLDRTVFGLERGARGDACVDRGRLRRDVPGRGPRGDFALPQRARRAMRDDGGPERVLGGDRQIITVHTAGPTIAFASMWPSSPPEIYCAEADGTGERRVSNANAEAESAPAGAAAAVEPHRVPTGGASSRS